MKFDQKGMGILEVVIAAGMLGGISLGVMQMMKTMDKGTKSVELRSNRQDVFNKFSLFLAKQSSCKQTFDGHDLVDGEDIDRIEMLNSDGDPVTVATIGDEFGKGISKIRLSSMKLENINTQRAATSTFPGESFADLRITMTKSAKNKQSTFGGESVEKVISLVLYHDDSDKIVGCYDKEGGAQAACDTLGGEMIMNGSDVVCSALSIVSNDIREMGLQVASPSGQINANLKPAELSFYDENKETGLHIRSWGLASDIETVNGPLVLNNKTVGQRFYGVDTGDADGDGDTTDVARQTKANDGRVQIGDYVPSNTDTLYVGGTVMATGTITSSSNMVATSFDPTSDIRLKKNIFNLQGSDKIYKLRSVSYEYKEKKGMHSGFIAQEVQKLFPHLVRKGPDGYLTLNTMEMVPYLVEELKKSKAKNNLLEKRLLKIEKLIEQRGL